MVVGEVERESTMPAGIGVVAVVAVFFYYVFYCWCLENERLIYRILLVVSPVSWLCFQGEFGVEVVCMTLMKEKESQTIEEWD